jgi:hypothetical protein
MRVFLDACMDPRAASVFVGHQVTTAFAAGWHRLKDHELLPLIQGSFDALVTIDGGFEHEHNLKDLSFGIVIVHVVRNKAAHYQDLAAELLAAVDRVKPGEVIHVGREKVGRVSL